MSELSKDKMNSVIAQLLGEDDSEVDIFDESRGDLGKAVKLLSENQEWLIFIECYGKEVETRPYRYDSNATQLTSDWYDSLEEAVVYATIEALDIPKASLEIS